MCRAGVPFVKSQLTVIPREEVWNIHFLIVQIDQPVQSRKLLSFGSRYDCLIGQDGFVVRNGQLLDVSRKDEVAFVQH